MDTAACDFDFYNTNLKPATWYRYVCNTTFKPPIWHYFSPRNLMPLNWYCYFIKVLKHPICQLCATTISAQLGAPTSGKKKSQAKPSQQRAASRTCHILPHIKGPLRSGGNATGSASQGNKIWKDERNGGE